MEIVVFAGAIAWAIFWAVVAWRAMNALEQIARAAENLTRRS